MVVVAEGVVADSGEEAILIPSAAIIHGCLAGGGWGPIRRDTVSLAPTCLLRPTTCLIHGGYGEKSNRKEVTTCPTALDGEAGVASDEDGDGDTDSEAARPHGPTLVEEEVACPGVLIIGMWNLRVMDRFHTLHMENPISRHPTGGQERFLTAHTR